MIYTITLNPALDLVLDYTSEKKIKKWARTNKSELTAGGKGINASIILNEIGIKNEAIILTGGFAGNLLLEKLKKMQVDYKWFDTKHECRINVKAEFEDTYEFLTNSSNANPDIEKELLAYLEKYVKEKDILLIMGSKMIGLSDMIIDDIAKLAIAKKARVVFDIADSSLLDLLKYNPLVVKPNKSELRNIFGITSKNFDVDLYANKLLELGAENVIVSNSCHGASLYHANDKWIAEPIKVRQINSSGAGDSMLACFVAEYRTSNNLEKALQFGNICGAATASSPSIANKEKIGKILAEITQGG